EIAALVVFSSSFHSILGSALPIVCGKREKLFVVIVVCSVKTPCNYLNGAKRSHALTVLLSAVMIRAKPPESLRCSLQLVPTRLAPNCTRDSKTACDCHARLSHTMVGSGDPASQRRHTALRSPGLCHPCFSKVHGI